MPDPLIIDSFAGGGGASTGIEAALGRSPDVAINHNAAALALHAANHPGTAHLDSNIWDVDPRSVTGGRPVGLLWASPDCKHFSKAKGAAPRDRNIRDLAWVVVKWAEDVAPDVILMENVEEFVTWGPVDDDGQPVTWLRGQTFDDWKRRLKRAGYTLDHRELRACDFGAPTIRKRFFLIARRDGRPIVWPRPTHGDPTSDAVRKGRLKPWRTAAECIDWSLPCPSIFATAPEIMADHGLRAVRPLKPNTLARVARGLHRYVLTAAAPFLIHVAHGDSGGRREYPLADPLGTVTGHGIQHGLVAPHLLALKGSARRSVGPLDPMSTVAASGSHQTPVAAFLAKYYGAGTGAALDEPMHTVTVRERFGQMQATLAAPPFGPEHHPRARAVAQLLRDYGLWDDREFVTLTLAGAEYVITDVGMRMLTPRELFTAQGFPPDYVIEGLWEGLDTPTPTFRPFPKDVQVSCCGNSVCPPLAEALVRANCGHLMQQQEVA